MPLALARHCANTLQIYCKCNPESFTQSGTITIVLVMYIYCTLLKTFKKTFDFHQISINLPILLLFCSV